MGESGPVWDLAFAPSEMCWDQVEIATCEHLLGVLVIDSVLLMLLPLWFLALGYEWGCLSPLGLALPMMCQTTARVLVL